METSGNNEYLATIHRPSLEEKLFFLICGIMISVPFAVFFRTFIDSILVGFFPIYATIFNVGIFTPFIEEFAKVLPLFYRHGESERSLFSLGFLVGLGFGVTEFLIYIVMLDGSLLIRLTGFLFHAASASITAYGIATKKTWGFYIIAVALHMVNNFAALSNSWIFVGPVVISITFLFSIVLYWQTTERLIDTSQIQEIQPLHKLKQSHMRKEGIAD